MKILIALAIVVLIFVVVAALQPADYRVERSIAISAPAALAFAQVNDLHKFQEMSPYVKHDPAAKYVFEGPQAGPGASLAWAGNSQVGEGRMTISESRPNQWVKIRLDFLKPFTSTGLAEFAFKSEGNQTLVTWSMSGQKNFVTKAIGLFMSMDKMIGGDFESGLENLKTLVETAAKK